MVSAKILGFRTPSFLLRLIPIEERQYASNSSRALGYSVQLSFFIIGLHFTFASVTRASELVPLRELIELERGRGEVGARRLFKKIRLA